MEILSNLAMTLDGKIAPASLEFVNLGSTLDREEMLRLRGTVDAVILGAENLRAYRGFCRAEKNSLSQPANVVVSRRLEGISPAWPFFKSGKDRRFLAVTGKLAPTLKNKFRRASALLELSSKKPLAPQLVAELKALGMTRILVEGGGALMWEFARMNLIDEYHVTLVPKILGGRESPTLVDGHGFSPKELLSLKLTEARPVANELYLIYRKL